MHIVTRRGYIFITAVIIDNSLDVFNDERGTHVINVAKVIILCYTHARERIGFQPFVTVA